MTLPNALELHGGYHFGGEPEKIFEAFFGTDNPYTVLNDIGKENLEQLLGYKSKSEAYIGPSKPSNLNVSYTLWS